MHERLADKRQVILILRLTLDERGQLAHGEVAKLEGEVIGRFSDWSQFAQSVPEWLGKQPKTT
jgi:hypothetical protein